MLQEWHGGYGLEPVIVHPSGSIHAQPTQLAALDAQPFVRRRPERGTVERGKRKQVFG